LPHLLDFLREISAMSINKRFCCGMEIPRASVITEALPRAKHLIFRSARQRAEIGKPPQPPVIIRDNAGNLRLLEHELGHKDCVRIASSAPGKIAAAPTKPANKGMVERANVFWRWRHLSKRPTSNPPSQATARQAPNVQLSIQKGSMRHEKNQSSLDFARNDKTVER